MTVLRSRKVLPAMGQKTSHPNASADNGAFEPVTPSKSLEPETNLPETNSPISSSPQSGSQRRGRSNRVVGTGSVRRSARLAKKMDANEHEDNVVVSSGKRNKVGSESDGDSSCSEADDENLEVRVYNSISLVEKLRTSDRSGADTVEDSQVTMNGRKRKRKLSTELESAGVDSAGNAVLEKGYLNLRSEKKVMTREMEEGCGSDGRLFQELESGKEHEIMSSDDALEEDGSVADMDEDGNDGSTGRKFSTVEKGKGKVGDQSNVTRVSASVNTSAGDGVKLTLGTSNMDASCLLKMSDSKDMRRLSREEKGKMKYEGEGSPSDNDMKPEVEILSTTGVSGSNQSVASIALEGDIQTRETAGDLNDRRPSFRERHRNIARRIASRFAHFSAQDELGVPDVSTSEIPVPEADAGVEDWPGPFSTAMKIIKGEMNRDGKTQIASPYDSEGKVLKWIPVKQDQRERSKQLIPSLQNLCLSVLAKNAESITSLECVPDMLRHKICWFLCDCRRMSSDVLKLLVHGSPTEIRLRDCSWLSEELFVKIFADCILDNLMVLQLDQCGPSIADYVLSSTLTRSPANLAALTTLSLKGAYRLTDEGLGMLVSSAPNLKSVDLSKCSMLTSEGICSLASSLRLGLMELYMDNCDRIDAMLILPTLLMLQNLEVLSLAGYQTVTDDFVSKLVSVHGNRMKEIILADCMELTDLSMQAIGDMCPGLHALDVRNVVKLTDVGICYLANGCREIQLLKLSRNAFSDEAVAAYLDIRGASLKELSLNSVIKVSSITALALARNCRNLQSLDVSWCRQLTNEALGLIVDTCTSLELLKLFGCTQVTSVFLDGYSNPRVKLIGLKLTSVLQHIDVPDFLHGPLRYSPA